MTTDKTPNIRTLTRKETKSRRKAMVIKVLSFKIQANKLSHAKKQYLHNLSLEAKYFYNYLVYLSQINFMDDFGNLIYPNNLFKFNTKSNFIKIFNHKDKSYEPFELKFLSSQVKQEILTKIQSSIKAISKAKSKGRKVGQLKFKSFINIPFKQFNATFCLSDNCKKLSLQGNKNSSFHLIRNRNLLNLAKELKLFNEIKFNNKIYKQVSLKKLIDLKIIEIANAELISSYNGDYFFNLTVYFNPNSLKEANLFQGTKLSQDELSILNDTQIGLDPGVASEQTMNCNETYASISMNSRNLINPNQIKQLKKLKKKQRKINRHVSKSKKAKKLGKSTRNNSTGFYTGNFKSLKQNINTIQNNINNHKKDTVVKLHSIFKLFKQVSFQDENLKSWHANKKFKYSSPMQKGLLGKQYSKLKHEYNHPDNKLTYKYKLSSKYLRTTKTCICGAVNKNITLKDREYICPQCGYHNNRDTHSSYIINNTLNHIEYELEYQNKAVLGCGIQSKDLGLSNKTLILDSNLGQIITSTKTEKVFHILSSKLKSQNFELKFNRFNQGDIL